MATQQHRTLFDCGLREIKQPIQTFRTVFLNSIKRVKIVNNRIVGMIAELKQVHVSTLIVPRMTDLPLRISAL